MCVFCNSFSFFFSFFLINYRPISLLSIYSKIFEKLIYSRMYYFLNKNNLIYEKQFGFRAKHSVNHALISNTELINDKLEHGNYVAGIFIDLEKAFDTVNHESLIILTSRLWL